MLAYVLNPLREAVCTINGITNFAITRNFNDIDTINFEVQRNISNLSTKESYEENPAYRWLHSFCQIDVPELGGIFLINSEPVIDASGTRNEHKTFTAESYESVLQFQNLVDFSINQGVPGSLEMFDDNLDEYGLPKKNIKLYDPDNPKFSLLHLVLRDDWYGWSIAHVDATIASKERAFALSSQNVYSFLRNDIESAFRCIVQFNTYEKTISLYDIETVGNNTNIYLSFRQFMDSLNISPISQNIPTVFKVAGEGELSIESVNYGSDLIYNIDWPISMCSEHIQRLWSHYKEYRESRRQEYAQCSLDYARLQEQRASILDRAPENVVANNWASTVYYSLDDLKKTLSDANTIVSRISQDYGGDEEEINASPDAAKYHSYKDVVIPNVTAEIKKRERNSEDPAAVVDYKLIWELFGLNELQTKRSDYQEVLKTLAEQGYDKDKPDRPAHVYTEPFEEQHKRYLTIKGYVEELDALISKKSALVKKIEAEMEDINERRKEIARSVSLNTYIDTSTPIRIPFENEDAAAGHESFIDCEDESSHVELEIEGDMFSREEQKQISELFRVSDYQDANYLVTDIDDTASTIDEQKKLLKAAQDRLEDESHPQLAWSITAENLLKIDEFKPLKGQLELGNFVTLRYDDEPFSTVETILDGFYDARLTFDTQEDWGFMTCFDQDFYGYFEAGELNAGDVISLTWDGTRYDYEIHEGTDRNTGERLIYFGNDAFVFGGDWNICQPPVQPNGEFMYVYSPSMEYAAWVVAGYDEQEHTIEIGRTTDWARTRDDASHAIMRITSISHSGLLTDNNFTLTFSTRTISKNRNDDFESLLGSMVSSRQNAISFGNTSSGSGSGSGSGGTSLFRPYLDVDSAKMNSADIQMGSVRELSSQNARLESAQVGYADVTDMNVRSLAAESVDTGIINTDQLYIDGKSISGNTTAVDNLLAVLSRLVTNNNGVHYRTFNPDTSYQQDAIVIQGGRIYRSLQNNNNTPISNSEYWEDVTYSSSYGLNVIMSAIDDAMSFLVIDGDGVHITRGTATTMAEGDSSTNIATTEFVMNAISSAG